MAKQGTKAEWIDHYNCHTLHLSFGMTLHVDWQSAKHDSPAGYKVHFCGAVLKDRFQSLPEAKTRAVQLANTVVRKLMEELAFVQVS